MRQWGDETAGDKTRPYEVRSKGLDTGGYKTAGKGRPDLDRLDPGLDQRSGKEVVLDCPI